MIESRELLTASAALVICGYLLANYARLSGVPNLKILITAFLLLTASLSSSLLEAVFWEGTLDFAQHALAPLGVIVLAVWSWATFVRRRGAPA